MILIISQISLIELIRQLSAHGITVNLSGNTLRVVRPPDYPTWEDVPREARPLLAELKRRKAEVLAFLQGNHAKETDQPSTIEVAQRTVIRIHPMRQACRLAGHCLRMTSEWDCRLFAVSLERGWCRERVKIT